MPDFGHDLVERTHVYSAYDQENLYFAFRCFDSQPENIKTSVTRRDNVRPDDWVCINLDSFNDQQSLYAFYVNPAGIQGDSRFASGREDHSFDLIWYSEGRVDEEGYTIEVRIPFKSIRFANKEQVEMGVIFERRISRRSEQGTYPPLDPDRGFSFLTQMKPMVFQGVRPGKVFELLPAVTYGRNSSQDQGRLVSNGHNNELSLTSKFGLTSELVLDGTYNPDFSQVEADAGQVDVNLRSPLFFAEKRPFFLEGSENFNFAASSGANPLLSIVHTRTITNPIVGMKLSGKIGAKNNFASIQALDELADAGEPTETGEYALFSIFRYKRALNDDNYVGAFYSGRQLKERFNRVLGTDGQLRLNQSSVLGYHLFVSDTKESKDTSSEQGHAFGIDYVYATRRWNINFGILDISEQFRTETGFIFREGLSRVNGSIGPKFYPNVGFIRRIDPRISSAQTIDKPSDLFETDNTLSLAFILWRNSRIRLSSTYSTEVFLGQRFDTAGGQISGSSQFTKQLFFSLSLRYGDTIRFSEEPFQGRGTSASAQVIFQPSLNLTTDVVYTYSDLFRNSNSEKIFEVNILRSRLTYQLNRYLFFRGILEYNSFRRNLLTDFLASFTYIPGTVLHFGYGSLYEKIKWQGGLYVDSDEFLETQRGIFVKASYLWRM